MTASAEYIAALVTAGRISQAHAEMLMLAIETEKALAINAALHAALAPEVTP